MKKFINVFAGMVMALMFAISTFGTVTALASDKPASMANAAFASGIYADDGYDGLMIALYDDNGKFVAYIADGTNDVFTDCTIKNTTVQGADEAQDIIVQGAKYTWFRIGNNMYLTDNAGYVAGARYIEKWEADAIQASIK